MLTLGAVGLMFLMQPGSCPTQGTALLDDAARRAAELDLPEAVAQLRAGIALGCRGAEVAAIYVRGLVDAREASRQGGSPESLLPVRDAVAALEWIAQGRPGPAEIARLVLQAAAAAAQSERDEMRLYLESAVSMEAVQRAAGQPGAPLVTATEVAGDLWLQVHRYDEARESYAAAARQSGPSLRVLAGLFRVMTRLGDSSAGCSAARSFVAGWGSREAVPDIGEARAYLAGPLCAQAVP